MIGRRNFSCSRRPHWDQICLVRSSRPIKRPLVCSAVCQKPSPAVCSHWSHHWETSPHQTCPWRCSSFWTLISTSSAEAGIRKLKTSRQCAIEYPFSPHKPAGGKSCVALLVWSVNWFSISDCQLKKSSLPTRHVQRTYKLAPSIDSQRGLNEKKKKKHLRGFFTTLLFGLYNWWLKFYNWCWALVSVGC